MPMSAPRLQTRHLGQHVEQFLADAVGEILVALVVTEVFEREHGDGFLVGHRSRNWSRM
jgi:hypothetical protein